MKDPVPLTVEGPRPPHPSQAQGGARDGPWASLWTGPEAGRRPSPAARIRSAGERDPHPADGLPGAAHPRRPGRRLRPGAAPAGRRPHRDHVRRRRRRAGRPADRRRAAGVHLVRRRRGRPPGEPGGGAGGGGDRGGPGGLPVHPRLHLGLPPAPARGGHRVRPPRRAAPRRGLAPADPRDAARGGPPRRRAVRRPAGRRGPRRRAGGHRRDRVGRRRGVGATRGGEPPLRLPFAGTPDVAVPSLELLLASDHEVVAVLTRPDAHSGRGRKVSRSPVAERADAAGVPVLQPRSPREPEFLERLTELAVDSAPVVTYGALVPQAALDLPRHGWVNLHFSLLPAWRGAAPVQHAVMAGGQGTRAPALPP